MFKTFLGIFIPALFAHLLTDFVFQTDSSIRAKGKLPGLIGHGLIAGILTYFFVGVVPGWELPLGVGLTHILLDTWKMNSQKGTRLRKFVLDQVGHVMILGLFSWAAIYRYTEVSGLWTSIWGWPYLLILTVISGAILSIYVVSFLVELTFEALGLQKRQASSAAEEQSSFLKEEVGMSAGGRIIGYLERSLILLFVLVGYPAGIGFLIAAKSIFRFGELTESGPRWLAEYIIIGTLLSILFGTLFAYLTVGAIQKIIP